MLNPLKVFGAGLSSWGSYAWTNYKKVLLCMLLTPFGFVAFCLITAYLAYFGFRGILWLAIHTPKSVNDFLNVHHVGVAYSMLGFVVLFVICHGIYQDGKKKLLQSRFE